MRSSEWIQRFNLSVKPSESRPDNPSGETVYRVKELFTTQFGSWEADNAVGAIPQWARDSYLRPWGADDYFDDAGGDHHLFARVLDLNGNPVKQENLIRYWSDGFQKLGDPNYNNYVRMTPKQGSGWANQVIFNSYVPERGEIGAWCWCPEGAADVVVGGGLPANLHISTFAVWQAQRRSGTGAPTSTDGGSVIPTQPTDGNELIRSAVWTKVGITFSNTSAFADYARRNNLGAPVGNETDVAGFRAQGYANAIVFAPIGQWQNIQHMSW